MQIWNLWAFFSWQIEHYALKSTSVQCYSVLSFSTANYVVNEVNLLNILNRTDYLYQKEAALVMCLVVQLQIAQIRLLKFV